MCGRFVRGRVRHALAVRLLERYRPANPEDVVRDFAPVLRRLAGDPAYAPEVCLEGHGVPEGSGRPRELHIRRVRRGSESSVKFDPLYIANKEWCDRAGEFQLTQAKFSTRLKERGYIKKRQKFGMVWYGIALKSDDSPPDDGSDPTPGARLGVDPAPPESGVDKPKNPGERAVGEGFEQEIRFNSGNLASRKASTGKTLHHPTPSLLPITNYEKRLRILKVTCANKPPSLVRHPRVDVG